MSPSARGRSSNHQRLVDRDGQLIGGERLEQSRGKLDTKVNQLPRRPGDTCADDRQPRVHHTSRLSEHSPDWRRWLNHQHIGTAQLLKGGHLDKNRLVAQSRDHPLEQPADISVGLADQDPCHVRMIGRAWEIPVGLEV
jgi:hypothetical protein